MNTINRGRLAAACAAGFVVSQSVPAFGDEPLEGCYTPVRGWATSICTESADCSTQEGLYRIVLLNESAPPGLRRLELSGTFEGKLVQMPNACGAATAEHVLNDRRSMGTITTGPDVGCFTGVGDFVNSMQIVETLVVSSGSGIYQHIVPGGTVTLTGRLGLKTGINRFRVTPGPGDEVCFSNP